MFDALADVTAIIKTFERPASLDLLIRSIRRFYPQLRILVGDDSRTPGVRHDVEYVRLPFDVGASAGRNALLQRVRTPYFSLLDDDLEFIPQTRIERLLEPVAAQMVDLAAGDYIRCKRRWFYTRHKPQPYHGLIELNRGRLRLAPGHRETFPGGCLCDVVQQFFIARTDLIRKFGGWDADLKTAEHEEFFVRMRRHGLRVGFCSDVLVYHWNARTAQYTQFRNRDYLSVAAAKMQIYKFTNFVNRTVYFPNRQDSIQVTPSRRAAG